MKEKFILNESNDNLVSKSDFLTESSLVFDTTVIGDENSNHIAIEYHWDKGDTYKVTVGEFNKEGFQVGSLLFDKTYPTKEEAEQVYKRQVRKYNKQSEESLGEVKLNEGHQIEHYKDFELDWNEDNINPNEATADFTVYILWNNKIVGQANGFKEARKWCDSHLDEYSKQKTNVLNQKEKSKKQFSELKINREYFDDFDDDEDLYNALEDASFKFKLGMDFNGEFASPGDKITYVSYFGPEANLISFINNSELINKFDEVDFINQIKQIEPSMDRVNTWEDEDIISEKLELSEDADKVNGDEEDLPVAELEEPIVVSTEVEEEPVPEEVVQNTHTGMVGDLMRQHFDLLDNYRSVIATLVTEDKEYTDQVVEILNSAMDEESIILGMLTKASELIDDKPQELMQQGEDKAEEIAAESEHPLDESLQLNEGHDVQEYKGFELDWNADNLDVEEGTADFRVDILLNGKEIGNAIGYRRAREWCDEYLKQYQTSQDFVNFAEKK